MRRNSPSRGDLRLACSLQPVIERVHQAVVREQQRPGAGSGSGRSFRTFWHELIWRGKVIFFNIYLLVLSCPVLSCPVLSCPVVSCRVVSCRVVSCHVMSWACHHHHSPVVSLKFAECEWLPGETGGGGGGGGAAAAADGTCKLIFFITAGAGVILIWGEGGTAGAGVILIWGEGGGEPFFFFILYQDRWYSDSNKSMSMWTPMKGNIFFAANARSSGSSSRHNNNNNNGTSSDNAGRSGWRPECRDSGKILLFFFTQ